MLSMFRLLLYISLAALPALLPAQDRTLTVHLRGVHQSSIAVIPMSGPNAFKPVAVQRDIAGGTTTHLKILDDFLPGEFVLRFDYKEKSDGSSYPSERQLLIAGQDLTIWANPVHAASADSTYWQPGERENTVYTAFLSENKDRRKALTTLQEFLLNYDNPRAKVYAEATKEYESRRKSYNAWVRAQIKTHRDLYAATVMAFELVPAVSFAGDETARKASLRNNYFSEADFSDPLIVRSSQMKRWMDNYVNLWSAQIARQDQTDSVFSVAGKTAIDAARKGHPLVYGWMVDYFFRGFESFGLEGGMQMLAPYLEDPNCLTERRQAIEKRLKGMETLVPGAEAPDFLFADAGGKFKRFQADEVETPYKLVLFWSASCGHCKELVQKLYPWSVQGNRPGKLTVYALSVDEGETDVEKWQEARTALAGWKHILTEGGINSVQANDYFVLSTPVMVLVRSSDHSIVAVPHDIQQLERAME